jgi:alpha-1,4-digalacturonate transport system substrate-binding protein
MTFPRTARTCAAAAAAGLFLAACAPGSSSDDDEIAQSDDANLTYLYFTDGPDEQAVRDLIDEFEDETGASVDLQVVPFDNLEQQLQGRLSAGNAPDVARLTSIDPFRADLLDLREFQADALDGQFLDGFSSYITGPDGELVAVPSDLTMNGPLINVDQFEAAGVELPDPADPWTWDEMVEAAEAVQDDAGTQYAIAMDVSGHRFSTMLNQFGTTFFTGDGADVALDPERTSAAITTFAELNEAGTMPRDLWLQAGSRYSAANEIFLAEQVPVYISGNWQVSAFDESAEFDWQVAPNPCEERCGGFPGGKFMVSFTQSSRQELAAEFIAFMNSAESQEYLAQQAAFLPTRSDLVEAGIDYPVRGDDMNVFLSEVAATPDDTYASAYNPAFSATATAVVDEIAKVLDDQMTPDEATEAIREAAEQALQDVG